MNNFGKFKKIAIHLSYNRFQLNTYYEVLIFVLIYAVLQPVMLNCLIIQNARALINNSSDAFFVGINCMQLNYNMWLRLEELELHIKVLNCPVII